MMTPTFRDFHATGIAVIDDQHRAFFRKMNELFDYLKQGRGKAEIGGIVDFLVGHVQTHLETEERFMAEANYEGIEDHRKQHMTFRDKVLQMKADLMTTNPAVDFIIRVNKDVVQWFQGHINSEDVKMAEFLRSRGE